MVVVVIASSFLGLFILLLYSNASNSDTFDKSKSSQMAIKVIAFNPARKWQSCSQTVWLQKVTMVRKSYELLYLLLL